MIRLLVMESISSTGQIKFLKFFFCVCVLCSQGQHFLFVSRALVFRRFPSYAHIDTHSFTFTINILVDDLANACSLSKE